MTWHEGIGWIWNYWLTLYLWGHPLWSWFFSCIHSTSLPECIQVFFSIGGGFSIPDELEYMIGVSLLRLAFRDFRSCGGILKLPLLFHEEEGVGIKSQLLLEAGWLIFLLALFLDPEFSEGKHEELSKLLCLHKPHPLKLIGLSSSLMLLIPLPFDLKPWIPFVVLSSFMCSWWMKLISGEEFLLDFHITQLCTCKHAFKLRISK